MLENKVVVLGWFWDVSWLL